MGLEGIRKAARGNRRMRFTALLHHVTPSLLVESFHDLKREAAAGVDGVTWRDYEKVLYTRVHELHREIHTGAYRAQASRRVYIPKADGKLRPLGIAALEDKIVQQAVVEDGRRIAAEKGTPQGAVISPLLANIYLHYVFDLWANRWRQGHATGLRSTK